MNKYLYFLLVMACFSCKTISIQQETQAVTTQNIMLGVIGEDKSFILEKDYNHTALPNYTNPIKIQVNSQPFTNSSYKAYVQANRNQNDKIKVHYIDSLSDKPRFVKLEVSDRVAVLNALNSKQNTDVKNYIASKTEAHIVTAISIVLKKEDVAMLMDANEVFLESSWLKSYSLRVYKNKELKQTIEFNEAVIFAYQASNFCWKENGTYELELVDIVEQTDKCPNKTYRNAKRAKKKIDYYKF